MTAAAITGPAPMSAPAAGFTVLHVANDDDVVLRPASANAPDQGRVAVRARPGMRRTDWLTRDLLAALGVDFTVTGAGRNADENLQLLPVRLIAGRITDVLVAGAESLTPGILTDLVLLAASAGTRLWLVTAPTVTSTAHQSPPGCWTTTTPPALSPSSSATSAACRSPDCGAGCSSRSTSPPCLAPRPRPRRRPRAPPRCGSGCAPTDCQSALRRARWPQRTSGRLPSAASPSATSHPTAPRSRLAAPR